MTINNMMRAIENMFGAVNPFKDMPNTLPIEQSKERSSKPPSQNAGQACATCPQVDYDCDTPEKKLKSVRDSEFCEELKLIVQHEASFESTIDFARALFDIDISSEYFLAGGLEIDYLRNLAKGSAPIKKEGKGYDRSTGKCLGDKDVDMQYVLIGWAIEKQIVGGAHHTYVGYSLLGRGLVSFIKGDGYKPNLFDLENLRGLQVGIDAARNYPSLSAFASDLCGCDSGAS